MATLVAEDDFDLAAFRAHLVSRLPALRASFVSAHPERDGSDRHLQILRRLIWCARDTIRPRRDDVLYFNDPESRHSFGSTQALYDRIQVGEIRF